MISVVVVVRELGCAFPFVTNLLGIDAYLLISLGGPEVIVVVLVVDVCWGICSEMYLMLAGPISGLYLSKGIGSSCSTSSLPCGLTRTILGLLLIFFGYTASMNVFVSMTVVTGG